METNGDGRCFFRSVAIATYAELREASRDDMGRPVDPTLQFMETNFADQMRSSLIVFMTKNLDTYSNLSPAVINSDLPPHFQLECNSMLDRLKIVSVNEACVGELEVLATAEMLEKTIIVVNEDGSTIMAYNDVYGRRMDKIVMIRFVQGEENAGHYQAVIVSDQQVQHGSVQRPSGSHDEGSGNQQDGNTASPSPPTPAVRAKEILPIPSKSPKVQTRKRRCQVPTLLTSSPHKTMLETRHASSKKTAKKSSVVFEATKQPGRRGLDLPDMSGKQERVHDSMCCMWELGSRQMYKPR